MYSVFRYPIIHTVILRTKKEVVRSKYTGDGHIKTARFLESTCVEQKTNDRIGGI